MVDATEIERVPDDLRDDAERLTRVNLMIKVLKGEERRLRGRLDGTFEGRVGVLDGHAYLTRSKDATGWKVTDKDAYLDWLRENHPEMVRTVEEPSPIALEPSFIENAVRLMGNDSPAGTELVHTPGRISVHADRGFLDSIEQVVDEAPRLES